MFKKVSDGLFVDLSKVVAIKVKENDIPTYENGVPYKTFQSLFYFSTGIIQGKELREEEVKGFLEELMGA